MQWIKDALEILAPGWVGSIIGLMGVAAAVATYLLTRQRTLLTFRYAGGRLLGLSKGGLPDDITVQYRGDAIPLLTRSLAVFWNQGETSILANDIVPSDPLRLAVHEDGRILSATVLKQSRYVNQIQTNLNQQNANEVAVHFSFLDSGDGAVVEILHTSNKPNVMFLGTVRGLPKGIRDLGRITSRSFSTRSIPVPSSPRRFGWVVTGAGIAIILIGLFVPPSSFDEMNKIVPGGLPFIVAGGFYAIFGSIQLLYTRRRHPKTLHIDEWD